ncbi:MAG: DNA-protecting protein DprA [Polaromonas sp.]|nr:DNA-protecting protein DprA [Polaromonas sp.]
MNAHDTDPDELAAWLRLTLAPGVGNDASRKLLAAFGSAQGIFAQSATSLSQIGTDRLVKAIQSQPPGLPALLRTTLEWLSAGDDRRIATLGDAAYPTALLHIADPPLMLYLLGSQVNQGCTFASVNIAIVGSRNPTPQGELNARDFAQAFAQVGLCVVSGLALGIDGAAHDGALLGGGQTIAVVGTGLDRVYPKKHLALAHRIAQQGMLMSEFPLGTPPLTANFPKRNRIISGLARGTLVVEAALKSGSLITARMALEQGKEVFAIPGSIHSPQSRGCHALIKQGAKLVELAQDVLEELQLDSAAWPRVLPISDESSDISEPDETTEGADNPLLTALGYDLVSLDALQARTGLPTPTLQAQLLDLELSGRVTRLPGGFFQRLSTA